MYTKTFKDVVEARQFAARMKKKGYRVSPVQKFGCLARGIYYTVDFAK